MTKESSRINRHSRRGFLAVSALTAVALLGGLSACSSEKASEKAKYALCLCYHWLYRRCREEYAPAADVTVMVGPGGDPHTYQPTTQDISKIKTSNVVLWSGLHMEAKMLDELAAQGDRQEAVAEAIPESERLEWPELGENGEKLWDPHVWNSTENWKYVVDAIAKKLSQVDKENAETYKKNAETYKKQIDQAAAYAKEQIDAIPAEKRILITGHDAFNYFGKQFGLEIHATDFVTSESEMSPTELADLGKFIAEKKIPTIFQDNLANPQAINSLKETVRAKGWNVEVSDKELYADSLGETAPTDTYIGVLKYNADAIKAALTK
ncbi:ABC-type metal ion transport system, periplasmic component [Corynebacterium pseudotuberculosis]|nr:ABC-type metal ion transport system, periplasmic component [Corynebacterium pseudotuberculosis]